MLRKNSATRFVSWQELEEMILALSQEMQFSDVWPNDTYSQIPAIMLKYRVDGDIHIKGKRFDVFSGRNIDVCLFKMFYEDESKYEKYDGLFYEEIIVPIDETPPRIIMPWEKV